MYKILVPLDDDEERAKHQIEAVKSLPGTGEIEVSLLYVFTKKEQDAPAKMKTAERVGTVKHSEENLEEAGIEYRVLEDSGNPAEEILRELERDDYDSVVMGGRKLSPAGKVLFGSVTQAVLLESDVPVTVTG
ncbi:MAG: universal stress protein [Halobacteria archaeon]|nr:universal stress protein [Halobacteria archaeon]